MKNISKIFISVLISLPMPYLAQTAIMKTISKNGMKVNYTHHEDIVSFQLSAPTTGWMTVGFNEHQGIVGSHLIMCRIIDGKAEVVEHFTFNVGRYKPITDIGGKSAISNIQGKQDDNNTSISFDIIVSPIDQYHKDLSKHMEYYITLAYSQSDDFQHHSIMRTNIKSIL